MRFAACLAVFALWLASAQAQEAFDWTGFYAGADIGFAKGTLESTDTVMATTGPLVGIGIGSLGEEPVEFPGEDSSDTISGPTAGFHAGYDWEANGLVLGLEGALQLGRVSLTSHVVATEEGPTYDTDAGLDAYGTAALRLGAPVGAALLYGTAGLAIGWGSADLTVTPGLPSDPDPPLDSSASQTHLGYMVGAGMELALDANWSVRGEYQYVDLGDATYDFDFATGDDSSVTTTSQMHFHTLRLGVSYRF